MADFSDKGEPAGPEREPAGPEREPAGNVDPIDELVRIVGERPPRRPKVCPFRGSRRSR
jgi:hypothetical protein